MSSSSARIRLWAVVTSAVLALSLVPPAAVADEVGPEPTPTAVSPEPSAEPTPEPTETSTPTPSPTPTATPTPTPAPTPKATVFGYYSLPWTAAVYQAWTDGKITAFSEATWKSRRKALGTPRVTPAPIRYVETSWSDTEYALVTFPQKAGDTAVDRVVVLTPAKKKQAGKHSVKRVAHVPTSTYFRYASSTVDRYVRTPDGSRHKLTATQYAKAGSRALTVVYGGYYRVKWSKDVTFVSRDGSRRELSAKQYAAAGKPRVAIAPTEYVKTPWTGVYALVTWPHEKGDTSVDQAVRLSSAQYKAAGSPTVHKRLRIPGDSFVRLTVGKTIYHRKSGYLTPVTTAQWKSAGSPKISTVKPAKPTYIRGILIANKSLPLPSTYGSGLRAELKTPPGRGIAADHLRVPLLRVPEIGLRVQDPPVRIRDRGEALGTARPQRAPDRPRHRRQLDLAGVGPEQRGQVGRQERAQVRLHRALPRGQDPCHRLRVRALASAARRGDRRHPPVQEEAHARRVPRGALQVRRLTGALCQARTQGSGCSAS
jgi:hypothetical protein